MSHRSMRVVLRAIAIATAALVCAVPAALGSIHHRAWHARAARQRSHPRQRAGFGGSLILGPRLNTAGGPPTSAQCIAQFGIACYDPQDMRNQYDFNPTYAPGNGDAGAGQTIVIFDSFGSPTIRQDLTFFDDSYGIQPPPSFRIYQPEGTVTYPYLHDGAAASKSYQDRTEISWGYETTLDVEWAHAMAPNANIALVETPVAESEGVTGLQNLENAQQWALENHIGTIWSNSYAATEQTFENPSVVQRLNALYHTAASQGISAFFATGDLGAANYDKQCTGASPKCGVYPYPTVNFPSSSPDVVSVGGTEIPVPQPALESYNPEQNWNDGFGAGGGGYSTVFGEPYYQAGIPDPTPPDPNTVPTRGLPDVSYNAALISSILIYESFDPTAPPGWVPIGGTSAATPQWAAIDAIANSADGPLGFLTPRLYQIYANKAEYASAFHDILATNNSFDGVSGYSAGAGWDATSGIGTPDVNNLVQALRTTTSSPAP